MPATSSAQLKAGTASSKRASASGRAIASSSSSQIQSCPAANALAMPSAKPPAPPMFVSERTTTMAVLPARRVAPAAAGSSLALSTI